MNTQNLQKNIDELISYYNDSAYARVDEITKLAETLIESDETIEEVEQSIFDEIDSTLEGYVYIECEDQGSFKRHIWHKIN